MSAPTYIGIDVGTSEVKGVAVDAGGQILARAGHAHRVTTPHEGHVEHDAERDWWGGFVSVLQQLLDAPSVDPAGVVALSCSGIGPCVLPVDQDGVPLRPAILYGVDTRAVDEVAHLTSVIGAEAVRERCGNDLTAQSAGPKIAWLATHEPEVHAKARWFLTCQSFLVLRLTGRAVVDHTTASYVHPLYRLDTLSWDLTGLPPIVQEHQLPELAWSGEAAGVLLPEVAHALGLPEGVVVAVGTADAVAETVGAGVREPGDVLCMYGSSGFFIAPTQQPRPTAGLYCAPGVQPGSWILAGGTSMAGAFLRWVVDLLGLVDESGSPDFPGLEALAASATVGANGATVLPHLAGERTPFDDPHARGAFVGLGVGHNRAELARAAIEGVAASMALALDRVIEASEIADHPVRVVGVGGGIRSRIWVETVADLTNQAQHLSRNHGGAAFGSAMLAAAAHGSVSCEESRAWLPGSDTVTPSPERQAHLADLLDRHRHTYAAVRAVRITPEHGTNKESS